VASFLALIIALLVVVWLGSTGMINPVNTGPTTNAAQQTTLPLSYDSYLRIVGITGESTDSGHEGWIGILSMSMGVHRSGSMNGLQYDEVVILKEVDSSTPKLYEALNTGNDIGTVQIDMVNPDNKTAVYTITLQDASVISINEGLSIFKDWGSASPIIYKQINSSSPEISKSTPMPINPPLAFGHDARYIEEVSFTFHKISWDYSYQSPTNQTVSVITGWDLLQNKLD